MKTGFVFRTKSMYFYTVYKIYQDKANFLVPSYIQRGTTNVIQFWLGGGGGGGVEDLFSLKTHTHIHNTCFLMQKTRRQKTRTFSAQL